MSEIDFDSDEESEISEFSNDTLESTSDIFEEAKILLAESESPEYQSNLDKPRLNAKKVQVAWFVGERGAGKTSSMEEDAEFYYNEYLTSMYLWASRSNENVFVAVNRNCKKKWKDFKNKIDQKICYTKNEEERQQLYQLKKKMKYRLKCNCDKAYPINWLVPNYYSFDGVAEYNFNWSGKDEFDIAFENDLVTRPFDELSRDEKKLLIKRKLKKPRHLIKTDLIRICPFTIPNNAKNKEIFEKEFVNYMLQARKEHRWIVMNPLMFLNETDKFSTISYIIGRVKFWADQYFQPMTPESVAKLRGVGQPVPKTEWTKIEKSWDKIHMILTEVRTIAPSNKYSPEVKSSMSKRVLVDSAPELRHVRVSLTADLQNIDDLNSSIKPMSNYVVIKRSSRSLLGDEYGWFLDMVEKKRNEKLSYYSHGKYDDFKKTPYAVREHYKAMIDVYLPRVSELPTNKGYVLWTNGEFRLETFSMARFHHKTEGETLQTVTNITWTVNEEKVGSNSINSSVSNENEANSSKRLKNYDEDKVKHWCAKQFVELGDWEKVLEKLRENISDVTNPNKLPSTGIESLDHKSISNRIRRDAELKNFLDFAKKNKNLPLEQILARLK